MQRHSVRLLSAVAWRSQRSRAPHCWRCYQPITVNPSRFVLPSHCSASFSSIASYTPSPPPSMSPPPPPPSPPSSSPPAAYAGRPLPRPPPPYKGAESLQDKNRRLLKYAAAVAIFFLGASYAAVPLYRLFCQRTGYGGTTQRDTSYTELGTGVSDREIEVTFMADTAPDLHWSFTPSQNRLKVRVGEPVLAFFKATNHREKPITGVATYNVTPMKTGFYFHKIQCFCFDEQRLRAHETVDMPVFFYIDPKINEDRRCNDVNHLTLSYTFFNMHHDEEEEGDELPMQDATELSAQPTQIVQPA